MGTKKKFWKDFWAFKLMSKIFQFWQWIAFRFGHQVDRPKVNTRPPCRPLALTKCSAELHSFSWEGSTRSITPICNISSHTGVFREYAMSRLRQNYTFCPQIFLLVTSRHQRWLGFQPYIPFFHIHLCTVGQFLFPR